MAVSLGVFSRFAAAVEAASLAKSTSSSLLPTPFGARSVPFAVAQINLRTARTLTSGAASKTATAASAGKGEPKGIMKPRRVSPEMQDFLGGGVTEIARTQALKEIWAYIKEHNLQDPQNKKIIVCDEKLKKIFAGKEQVGFLEIGGLISPHFLK